MKKKRASLKKRDVKKKKENIEYENILNEVIVLATMSSGKSTIINTLLGEDILPNENQACTAKIFKILDNDKIDNSIISAINHTDELVLLEKESLYELNKKDNIKEIIVEGNFKGIKNKKERKKLHQICLVDTPGPNNSLDSSHKEITYKLLEEGNTNHLVYVLNATQIGVNDDKKLLLDILEYQKSKNKNFDVTFVLNKSDEILLKDEDMEAILENCKNYLKELGFLESSVIPLSAYAGKLFKFALEGKLKTRKEKNDFTLFYDLFEEKSLSSLIPKRKTKDKTIVVQNLDYSKSDIMSKYYATGMVDLEKALENVLHDKIYNKGVN